MRSCRFHKASAVRTGFWKGSAAVSTASSTAALLLKTTQSASSASEPCGLRVSKFTAARSTKSASPQRSRVSGLRGKLVSQPQRSLLLFAITLYG
jgi:hypothetical protein